MKAAIEEGDVQVSWWVAVLAVLLIGSAMWDGISSPRKARELCEKNADTGWHSEAIAKQRRLHRRRSWCIPCGALVLAANVLPLFFGELLSGSNVLFIALGLSFLVLGAISLVCLRILGPRTPAASG